MFNVVILWDIFYRIYLIYSMEIKPRKLKRPSSSKDKNLWSRHYLRPIHYASVLLENDDLVLLYKIINRLWSTFPNRITTYVPSGRRVFKQLFIIRWKTWSTFVYHIQITYDYNQSREYTAKLKWETGKAALSRYYF